MNDGNSTYLQTTALNSGSLTHISWVKGLYPVHVCVVFFPLLRRGYLRSMQHIEDLRSF